MKISSIHSVLLILFFGLGCSTPSFAQDTLNEEKSKSKNEVQVIRETEEKKITRKRKKRKKLRKIKPYEPLAPARAAFYAAVLPGLGQAYTNNFWKIPLVYAAIGGGLYYYSFNNKMYNETRDIYKRRLAGFRDDRFIAINEVTGTEVELISNEGLLNAQRNYRKDRELAILLTGLAYILNIVDANVSAHLQQYNINDNLTMRPNMEFDQQQTQLQMGLKLQYNF